MIIVKKEGDEVDKFKENCLFAQEDQLNSTILNEDQKKIFQSIIRNEILQNLTDGDVKPRTVFDIEELILNVKKYEEYKICREEQTIDNALDSLKTLLFIMKNNQYEFVRFHYFQNIWIEYRKKKLKKIVY